MPGATATISDVRPVSGGSSDPPPQAKMSALVAMVISMQPVCASIHRDQPNTDRRLAPVYCRREAIQARSRRWHARGDHEQWARAVRGGSRQHKRCEWGTQPGADPTQRARLCMEHSSAASSALCDLAFHDCLSLAMLPQASPTTSFVPQQHAGIAGRLTSLSQWWQSRHPAPNSPAGPAESPFAPTFSSSEASGSNE